MTDGLISCSSLKGTEYVGHFYRTRVEYFDLPLIGVVLRSGEANGRGQDKDGKSYEFLHIKDNNFECSKDSF